MLLICPQRKAEYFSLQFHAIISYLHTTMLTVQLKGCKKIVGMHVMAIFKGENTSIILRL